MGGLWLWLTPHPNRGLVVRALALGQLSGGNTTNFPNNLGGGQGVYSVSVSCKKQPRFRQWAVPLCSYGETPLEKEKGVPIMKKRPTGGPRGGPPNQGGAAVGRGGPRGKTTPGRDEVCSIGGNDPNACTFCWVTIGRENRAGTKNPTWKGGGRGRGTVLSKPEKNGNWGGKKRQKRRFGRTGGKQGGKWGFVS